MGGFLGAEMPGARGATLAARVCLTAPAGTRADGVTRPTLGTGSSPMSGSGWLGPMDCVELEMVPAMSHWWSKGWQPWVGWERGLGHSQVREGSGGLGGYHQFPQGTAYHCWALLQDCAMNFTLIFYLNTTFFFIIISNFPEEHFYHSKSCNVIMSSADLIRSCCSSSRLLIKGTATDR